MFFVHQLKNELVVFCIFVLTGSEYYINYINKGVYTYGYVHTLHLPELNGEDRISPIKI